MSGGGQVPAVDESRIGLVVMLLCEGGFQDAVKVYQDESGEPYRIARKAVVELARKHSIPTRRPSLVSLLLVTLAGALGAVVSMSIMG